MSRTSPQKKATRPQAPAPANVILTLKAPNATGVAVSGDFNLWVSEGTAMTAGKDGTWKVNLSLAPGTYEYKFIVDGEWLTDPANPNTVLNTYGSNNSVLTVKK